MLSLKDCRSALGPDASISDEDLLRLRDQMYSLAQVAAALFASASASPAVGRFDKALMLMPDAEREATVERAAILEFEAGVPRGVAERMAVGAAAEQKIARTGKRRRT
jgi:hypothetical protein